MKITGCLSLCTLLLVPALLSAKEGVTDLDDALEKQSPAGAVVKFLASPETHDTKAAFFAHLTLPANSKVAEHRDASEEYLYFLEGKGTIWINDKKYDVDEKDLVYMPANSKVRFEAGDRPVRLIQVFAPLGSEKKYDTWKAKE